MACCLNGVTIKFHSFIHYAVGFPNISEVRPSFKEIYTEDMMKDAECLLKIVKDQNSPVDNGEIFSKSGRQSTQEMIDMMGERAALPGKRYIYGQELQPLTTGDAGRTFGIVSRPDMATNCCRAMSEQLYDNAG